MKVGAIQSNYLPWRGYFDFIDEVDLFVFHDDLQYTKGDWRNRNRIKTSNGDLWITVPVRYQNTEQLICETAIDYSQDWPRRHANLLKQWYGKAPFFEKYHSGVCEILAREHPSISALNVALCQRIMDALGIKTPLRMSAEFGLQGKKTERLIDLLKKVGATVYLSGPAAKDYLDESMFRTAGIALEYKRYDYPPYPQLWDGFSGAVTVLDLLFNTGPEARRYLKSLSPNERAVQI